MADLLNVAVSGLTTYQGALSTTSHNIANVETEGYSRQRVEYEARNPIRLGGSFFGQGVGITDINRIADEFIIANIREFSSSTSRLEIGVNLATRLENLIADENGSLLPALDSFFNGMADVANDPASSAPREALMVLAEVLAARFNTLGNEMQKLDEEVDSRIIFEVADINAIAAEIARINDSIARISSSTDQPPDLLDKRDVLLQQLSERIGTTVVEQSDGTLNVLVGTGQLIVTGSIALELQTRTLTDEPDRLGIGIVSSGAVLDITNNVTGGTLGGLLDFRENLLDKAINNLGRTAIALSESFNTQHNAGFDLNNQLGADFFSVGNPQVLASSLNNAATLLPVVTVTDASALTTSDYRATFAAGIYTITRLNDNVVVGTPGAGPVFAGIDGLDFDFTGIGPTAGDSFLVRPTSLGAISFTREISDADSIAAASPIKASRSVTNIGDIDVSNSVVVDANDTDLLNRVVITFNSPANTFDVVDTVNAANNVANVAYTSGDTLTFNGWQIELNGTAQPGDSLIVEANVGGAGDNQNALLLADLDNQDTIDNQFTYEQSYSAMTSIVGAITQQLNINLDVEESLLNQAIAERESISGVNLDEEAANLIRYQQAYQASARVVQTAQEIFDALLAAI